MTYKADCQTWARMRGVRKRKPTVGRSFLSNRVLSSGWPALFGVASVLQLWFDGQSRESASPLLLVPRCRHSSTAKVHCDDRKWRLQLCEQLAGCSAWKLEVLFACARYRRFWHALYSDRLPSAAVQRDSNPARCHRGAPGQTEGSEVAIVTARPEEA